MKIVSQTEMQEVIETVKTSTFVSIQVETEVDMNKTGNPFYGATKTNVVAGQIGFDYENAVNNQLGREDKPLDFSAQAHKWAVPMENGCRNLVQNKDRSKTYLRIKVQGAGEPTYKFEGQIVSKEAIAPYLKPHRKPLTQDGVDKEIVVRMYALANILAIKIMGEDLAVGENIAEHIKVAQAVTEPV